MAQGITDEVLLNAIRQRVLEDIQNKQAQNVINNMVGGGMAPEQGASAIFGQMANKGGLADLAEEPDMQDYNVDILKEDLYDPINDEKYKQLAAILQQHPEVGLNPKDIPIGKPKGWKKSVRRYRSDDKKKEKPGKK
jgi:hypothetical protein